MKKPTKKQPNPMTDGEREAVAVARDVIAQLNAKRFVATSGLYVDFLRPLRATAKSDDELREVVGDRKCRVCQKGAFFMSALRRNDDLAVGSCDTRREGIDGRISGIDHATISGYVVHQLGILSVDEFNEMERAFEVHYVWLTKYKTEDERMRAICRNVIRNRGHFDISDL